MIKILVDSTADIDAVLARELDVLVVPLKVVFGADCYRDGVDLTNQQFYEMLTGGKVFPTTSQPSPEDFLVHFEAAKAAGDSVVVLTLSAEISGTCQSAAIAQEMCDYADIYIVDSQHSVCSMRLLAEQAVSLRAEGLSAAAIADRLAELRSRIRLYVIVDTLEYFYKGGRLSKTGHIAGTLLNVKPIVSLVDGVLTVVGKARGQNNAIEFVLDKIAAEHGLGEAPVCFGYTASRGNMDVLRQAVMQRFGYEEERISSVGSVVGTHMGPGAALIAFLPNEKK